MMRVGELDTDCTVGGVMLVGELDTDCTVGGVMLVGGLDTDCTVGSVMRLDGLVVKSVVQQIRGHQPAMASFRLAILDLRQSDMTQIYSQDVFRTCW